jgi:hypothetical protein
MMSSHESLRGMSMPLLPYKSILAIGAVVEIALHSGEGRFQRSISRIGFIYHGATWSTFCRRSFGKAFLWECAGRMPATGSHKRGTP